ncbi:hypothetical protein SUGI_0572560 [Cryptomeria japonica]|nr:hypothetical protein SUGI_0572560 [Cryptomeria japonica]
MPIIVDMLLCIVNFLSFAVTHACSILLLVIIKTFVSIPGEALRTLCSYFMTAILSVLEYLVEFITGILVLGVSFIGSLIQSTIEAFVSSLLSILSEFISESRGALHTVEDFVTDLVQEIVNLVGASMVNVWNNFIDALSYFVNNL